MIGIDLGSNTIRFIQYSEEKNGFIKEYEAVVRTAENLSSTGQISKTATRRIIQAILEAEKILDFDTEISAVATAAFRNAKNSLDVIKEIYDKTSIKFTIISGELEAKLTALSVTE